MRERERERERERRWHIFTKKKKKVIFELRRIGSGKKKVYIHSKRQKEMTTPTSKSGTIKIPNT